MKYAFIQAHRTEFHLTSMCRVLKVHRSGYYAWLHEPLSPRAKANEALTVKIHIPGIELAQAQALVDAAHQVCPYSNATRGNVEVTLTVI